MPEAILSVPAGVTVAIDGLRVRVKGPKGEVERTFRGRGLSIALNGSEVKIAGPLVLCNTANAHINNMLNGVTKGFSYKLKMIYAHFPIQLEVKGKELLVKNFLGEKQPRRCAIVGATKIEIKPPEVTLSGPSRDDVGQTIANLKKATKIWKRDSRVFQDGLYLIAE